MKLNLFKRYFLFAGLIASFAIIPVACSSDDGDPVVPEETPATPDPTNAATTITATAPTDVDGTLTSTVTVTIADTDGNTLTESAGVVTLTSTGAAVVSGVTDNANGTYTATVTDTVAETVTVSGKLGDADITDTAEIVFPVTAGPADPTNAGTTITATAPELIEGVSTSTVTVQLADANGVPLTTSGGLVTITPSGSAVATEVIDNGDGSYTATVTNDVQENITVTGALDGVAITGTTDITFNPDDQNPAIESVPQTPEDEIIGTSLVRINSGGPEVTLDGKIFEADKFFDTENTTSYTNPNVTEIAGTEDDALFLSERITKDGVNIKGPFSYNIPVANGTYTVRLYFAEIYWGSENPEGFPVDDFIGKRIFNVSMEGNQIFAGYDLVKDVSPATADSRMYNVEVTDGELNITFEASVNKPKVSGIEVFGMEAGM
ncbi:MAG: invasin domain 3-containing protein [Pricia sp.]